MIYKKIKLKKKWRFWRLFKKKFIYRNKKNLFIQLRNFIFMQKLIKRQYLKFYGKSINKYIFKKNQTKFITDFYFFNILSLIETRLNILVSRMFFINLFEIDNNFIKNYIFVNKKYQKKNYLIPINSVINIISKDYMLYSLSWNIVNSWRWFNWRKYLRQKNLGISIFWNIKFFLCINFFEVNLKYLCGILLRKPVLGEIILNNYKKNLTHIIFSKIYLIY